MKLIYSYVKHFRNIYNQEFYFSKDYKVNFDGRNLNICYNGPSDVRSILFPDSNMQNLCILLGKTGSGKTNILQLIGMNFELRLQEDLESAYFLLYADDQNRAENRFYIEIANMRIEGINSDKEFDKPERVHEKIDAYIEALEKMQMYSFCCDFQNGISHTKEISYRETDETVIVNGFDRNAFIVCPYSEVRNNQHDDSDEWLMRYAAPYHRTEVGCMCDYIHEYLQEFQKNSIKHKAALVIRWDNWSKEIEHPLDDDLAKCDYWTFAERREKELEDALLGKVAKKSKKTKVSIKHQFIHDLWMDYAIYLRKWIEHTETFYFDEIPEEHLDYTGTKDVYQEYLDYAYEKEYGDEVDPTILPDYEKMSVVKRIFWLAQYIDRKVDMDAHGVVYQIAEDIKDIGNTLEKFADKYFTEDAFILPINEMYTEENRNLVEILLECMEQYIPDGVGLFERELLPYEFSCLSSGEVQYAKIFGAIEEYCIKMKMNGRIPNIICLLDEPEVYMHPELCRQFIWRAAKMLKKKEGKAEIQLIVSTHSPFMLSDVLPEQIIRVNVDEKGKCHVMNGSEKQYFGANIHTIMADGFFLDYTIGEYSREYLQQMQDDLKKMINHAGNLSNAELERITNYQKVIPYIGDKIIRNSFEILLEILL